MPAFCRLFLFIEAGRASKLLCLCGESNAGTMFRASRNREAVPSPRSTTVRREAKAILPSRTEANVVSEVPCVDTGRQARAQGILRPAGRSATRSD